MKKNVPILMVLFCAIFAGQVFAVNPAKQLSRKSAAVQMPSFSKLLKGNKEGNKRQKGRSLAENIAAAEQTTASLRSTLEPGHSRPDSAIYRSIDWEGEYERDKYIFSYKGDTIVEKEYGKGYYAYDPEEDHYTYIETDTWYLPDYRQEEYVFDANGNTTFSCRTYYENDLLESSYKSESAYNPNGFPLFEKSYEWEDGEWLLRDGMTYQYDESGMLTGGSYLSDYDRTYSMVVSGTFENMEIAFVLDGITRWKQVAHYNPATMKLLAYEYYYPSEEGILELEDAATYTYDAAGRLLTTLYYYYEGKVDYSKIEYAYNANGQILSETHSNAESQDAPYSSFWGYKYQYVDNRLMEIEKFDSYEDGDIYVYGITTFYYSGGTGIADPFATKELNVHSSNGYVSITLPEQIAGATLQLIDAAGRTVLETQVNSGQPVAVHSLPNGVYIYRIVAGNVVYSGKTVIR